MKRITILLIFLLCSIQYVQSQKVDSINVEQTGDFIKIRYKILNSNSNQLFRIRVLCAINGGLNTEIKSVSGDTGDNVVGGKDDYFVVWDVLKDVSELTSAEFIVRAELVKDLNSSKGGKNSELTEKWSKKRFFFMLAAEAPSPKVGFKVGYMGSFGISFQFLNGYAAISEPIISTGSTVYNTPKVPTFSLNLTKRIANINGFQMHLMAGIQKTELISRDPNAINNPYHREKVFGPELGMAFGIRRFAISLSATHFDPGQFEKQDNRRSVSPLNYFSSCIGIRF